VWARGTPPNRCRTTGEQIVDQVDDICNIDKAVIGAIGGFTYARFRSSYKEVVDQKDNVPYVNQTITAGISGNAPPDEQFTGVVTEGD
jgi:hypothetical protein